MQRWLVSAVAVVTSVGCIDFDGAFRDRVAELADAGAGGGSAGGGSAGGGSAGGGNAGGGSAGGGAAGGGAAGGGAAGGGSMGGGSGDAGFDAGCPDVLCPIDRLDDGGVPQVWRIIAAGGDDVVIPVADNQQNDTRFAYPGATGWTWRATTDVIYGADGLSQSDFWIVGDGITHYRSLTVGSTEQTCGYVDDPSWYAVSVRSATEAWFVGADNAVCQWKADAGFIAHRPKVSGVSLTEVWVGPRGRVVIGGEDGQLTNVDGGPIGSSGLPFSSGVIGIHGTDDDDFWAVSGNDVYALHVVDGGMFQIETPAVPYTVRAVTPTEVWTGGFRFLAKLSADAGLFERVTLNPGFDSVGTWVNHVRENGPDQLIVGGGQSGNDENGVIRRYRRQGR